jgi:formate-dependent nitrite reductase cytochrome c552 subunit
MKKAGTVKLDLKVLFDPEARVAIVSNCSKCTLKYYRNETGLQVELYDSGELIEKVYLYNEDITVEDVMNALKDKSLKAIYARK